MSKLRAIAYVLAFACLLIIPRGVHAATLVNFSWLGGAGYTATGGFLFDELAAPTFLSESGSGTLNALKSFTITFTDPTGLVLESGSSVVGGVSSDRFLRLDYNVATRAISVLDADIGGSSYQYFLTNLRTPAGQVVPPGVTDFNLFFRPNGTPILDSATTVRVTSVSLVPEPASGLLILVASVGGSAGCGGEIATSQTSFRVRMANLTAQAIR